MKVKNNRLAFITLKKEYLNYMMQFDNRVPTEHKDSNKRPYTGILVNEGDTEYVIPLSSPKEKHKKMRNSIDFLKIDEGKLGAINFNNILPVYKDSYEIVELHSNSLNESDLKYISLVQSQLTWLNINENRNVVLKKAEKLIKGYKENTLYPNVKERCCNFPLLEEKCIEWGNIKLNSEREAKSNYRDKSSEAKGKADEYNKKLDVKDIKNKDLDL